MCISWIQTFSSFRNSPEHIQGFEGKELWSSSSDPNVCKEEAQVVSPVINAVVRERCPIRASWSSLLMIIIVYRTALICMSQIILNHETGHLLPGKKVYGAKQSCFSICLLTPKNVLAHALQPFCSNRPKSQWAESTVRLCPWWGSWSFCYTMVCLDEPEPCTPRVAFSLFICSLFNPAFLCAGCKSVIAQPAAVLTSLKSHYIELKC